MRPLRNPATRPHLARRRERARRRAERGAALVIAILVLAILTVIGIALMLITSTESRIAANEWSVNRAFYASDAGIRWATVEMRNSGLRSSWRGRSSRETPSARSSSSCRATATPASAGFFQGTPTRPTSRCGCRRRAWSAAFPAPRRAASGGPRQEEVLYYASRSAARAARTTRFSSTRRLSFPKSPSGRCRTCCSGAQTRAGPPSLHGRSRRSRGGIASR